jgi:hypothetical protein
MHERLVVTRDNDSFMAMQFPTDRVEGNWLFVIEI